MNEVGTIKLYRQVSPEGVAKTVLTLDDLKDALSDIELTPVQVRELRETLKTWDENAPPQIGDPLDGPYRRVSDGHIVTHYDGSEIVPLTTAELEALDPSYRKHPIWYKSTYAPLEREADIEPKDRFPDWWEIPDELRWLGLNEELPGEYKAIAVTLWSNDATTAAYVHGDDLNGWFVIIERNGTEVNRLPVCRSFDAVEEAVYEQIGQPESLVGHPD